MRNAIILSLIIGLFYFLTSVYYLNRISLNYEMSVTGLSPSISLPEARKILLLGKIKEISKKLMVEHYMERNYLSLGINNQEVAILFKAEIVPKSFTFQNDPSKIADTFTDVLRRSILSLQSNTTAHHTITYSTKESRYFFSQPFKATIKLILYSFLASSLAFLTITPKRK